MSQSLMEKLIQTIPEPERISNIDLSNLKNEIRFRWINIDFRVTSDLKVSVEDARYAGAAVLLRFLLSLDYDTRDLKEKEEVIRISTKTKLFEALSKEEKLPMFETFVSYYDLLHKLSNTKPAKRWITLACSSLRRYMGKNSINEITTKEFLEFSFTTVQVEKKREKERLEFLRLLRDKVQTSFQNNMKGAT